MYKKYFEELNKLDEDYFFEMANITKEESGLPYQIWIDSEGKNRRNTHSLPRIKVLVDNKLIPVLISDDPKIPESVGIKSFKRFNEIRDFIVNNLDILMAHWDKKLTDTEALIELRKRRYVEIPGQISFFDD